MTDRLLEQFLDEGLLDLQGNDQWYGHISSTASSLSKYLRANPQYIIPFTYAALTPEVSNQNPAVEKAVTLLKSEWKTYASISMASPRVMLRAIIFDALLKNADSDDATKSLLALLLASALPHLSLGKEEEVWTRALGELLAAVEIRAEARWSVPSQLEVPDFPKIDVPAIRFSVKSGEFDQETLQQGLVTAAGPTDEQGEATEGNNHWANAGEPWSREFAPLAASAISEAIVGATGTKTGSVKPEALTQALTGAIANYLKAFARDLASTTHGVEMRSRLLWWKEALVSPSARVSYREIDSKLAPGLMAYDYHTVLPSLAPASVTMFLTETVRAIEDHERTLPLVEWLKALTTSPHAETFRKKIQSIRFAEGYRPVVSLITSNGLDSESIATHTVFSPNLTLTAAAYSQLVFLELQAIKAIAAIDSMPRELDHGSDKQAHDDEDEA